MSLYVGYCYSRRFTEEEAKKTGKALGHISVKVAVGKLTGQLDFDDAEDPTDQKIIHGL